MAEIGEPTRRSLSAYKPPPPPPNLVDRIMEAVARGETESSKLTVRLEHRGSKEDPGASSAGFDGLVAVTPVPKSIANNAELLSALEDEVLVSAGLEHANVSRTFGLRRAGRFPVLAVELVYGATLDRIIEKARARGKPLRIDIACSIIAETCKGLEHAHGKRDEAGRELHLVHHGVTPRSIAVSYDGQVKISGFGLAKVLDRVRPVKGYRARYLSPEQVQGHPLDQRSDVFSLGIVLFELLTLENPFESESDKGALDKIRNVEVVPPSTLNTQITDELEQAIFKALSPTPEFRFQRASDLGEAIERFAVAGALRSQALTSSVKSHVPEEKLPVEIGGGPRRRADGTLPVVVPPPPPPRAPAKKPPAPPRVPRRLQTPPPPPKVPTRPPPLPPGVGSDRDSVASSGPPDEMDSLTTAPWSKNASLELVSSLESELPRPPDDSWTDPEVQGTTDDSSVNGGRERPDESRHLVDPALDPAVFAPSEIPSTIKPSHGRRISTYILSAVAVTLAVVLLGALAYFVSFRPGRLVGTAGAQDMGVTLDGRPVAVEEGRFEVAGIRPGRHTVVFRVGGDEVQSQDIDIRPGGTVVVIPFILRDERPAAVQPPRKTGIAIEPRPDGASISIDGVERPERTPVDFIELSPGTHVLRLEKEGYEPFEREVAIDDGVIQRIDEELAFSTATVKLHLYPRQARCVLVEEGRRDRRVGRTFEVTPLLGPKLRCSARDHESSFLELDVSDGRAHRGVIVKLRRETLLASKSPEPAPQKMREKLLPMPSFDEVEPVLPAVTKGFLSVNTVPWSKVYVNGRVVGNTPVRRHELPVGSYTIRCVNPQYGVDFTQSVSITASQEKRLVKRLEIPAPAPSP